MKKYENYARAPMWAFGDVTLDWEAELNVEGEELIGWTFNNENPAYFYAVLDSESSTGYSWVVPRFFMNQERTRITLAVIWINGGTWEMRREILFSKTRAPIDDVSSLSFSARYLPVLNSPYGVVFQVICKGIGVSNWDTITADEPYRTGTTEPSEVFVLYSKQEGIRHFDSTLKTKFSRKGRWVHQLASVEGPIPDDNLGGLSMNGAAGIIHMVIKKNDSDDLLIVVDQPPAAISYYNGAAINNATNSQIAGLPDSTYQSGYVFYTSSKYGSYKGELRSGATMANLSEFGQVHGYWDPVNPGNICFSVYGSGRLTNYQFDYLLYNPLKIKQSYLFFTGGELAPWILEKNGKKYFSFSFTDGSGRGYGATMENLADPSPYTYPEYVYSGGAAPWRADWVQHNGLYQVGIKMGNTSREFFPADGKITVFNPTGGGKGIYEVYLEGQGLDARPDGPSKLFDPLWNLNEEYELPSETRFFLNMAKCSPFVKHDPERMIIETLVIFSNKSDQGVREVGSLLTFKKLTLRYGRGFNAHPTVVVDQLTEGFLP